MLRGSDLGLAISARLGSTYEGGLHGAVSGELRYAFDVFTYVPWAGVGLGLRLDDKVVVFPQATLGLSMMQGFDDALGIFVTKPLLFSGLSGPFPPSKSDSIGPAGSSAPQDFWHLRRCALRSELNMTDFGG